MSWRVDEQAADAVACAPRHAGALMLAGCAAIELGGRAVGWRRDIRERGDVREIIEKPPWKPLQKQRCRCPPASPVLGCSAPVKLECSAKSDPGLCTVVVAVMPEIHDKLTFSKPPSKTDPQVG